MATWSLSTKLHQLLLQELHTDITFTFEDGSFIHAHKLPLIAASPVFEAMLTGPLKENEAVKIQDTSINVWRHMLQVSSVITTGILGNGYIYKS